MPIDRNMNININRVLDSDFSSVKNYQKNKALVYSILRDVNSGKYDKEAAKAILEIVKPAIQELRKVQDTIRVNEKENPKWKKTINNFVTKARKIYFGSKDLNFIVGKVNEIIKNKDITGFQIETKRTEKFREVVKKLTPIAKGASVPGSKVLAEEYWLEPIQIELKFDDKTFKGNIYMGYFAYGEDSHLKKWKEQIDSDGIPLHEKHSFQDYMNNEVIPHLSLEAKEEMQAACLDMVDYYTPDELETLKAHFSNGVLNTATTHLNSWSAEGENSPCQTQSYRTYLQSQTAQVQSSDRHPVNTGKYMYLLNNQNEMYVQMKKRGQANHTSLSSGQAVLAAGHIYVVDGKIKTIDTQSGHYQPTKEQILNILEYFQNQMSEEDLNSLTVSYAVTKADGLNVEYDQIEPGRVIEWMQDEKNRLLEELKSQSLGGYKFAIENNYGYRQIGGMLSKLKSQS